MSTNNIARAEPAYTRGSDLHPDDKRHVLAAFVHRFTKDHRPAWVDYPGQRHRNYPVQFASDADWLAHTVFRVRRNGRLDRRAKACMSTPTWPDNPELRQNAKGGAS